MGTRKPFYLYFAFLGLCRISLATRHCTISSCIFLTISLDRFSGFHINKYKYELRYLYHENVAAVRSSLQQLSAYCSILQTRYSPLPYPQRCHPGVHRHSVSSIQHSGGSSLLRQIHFWEQEPIHQVLQISGRVLSPKGKKKILPVKWQE